MSKVIVRVSFMAVCLSKATLLLYKLHEILGEHLKEYFNENSQFDRIACSAGFKEKNRLPKWIGRGHTNLVEDRLPVATISHLRCKNPRVQDAMSSPAAAEERRRTGAVASCISDADVEVGVFDFSGVSPASAAAGAVAPEAAAAGASWLAAAGASAALVGEGPAEAGSSFLPSATSWLPPSVGAGFVGDGSSTTVDGSACGCSGFVGVVAWVSDWGRQNKQRGEVGI